MEQEPLAHILRYFANLFRLQLNRGSSPCAWRRISADLRRNEAIFELQVKRGSDKSEEWVTRRMSIGSLGDESGSKSRCYKVVYDNLMVVKIPPSPMIDFKRYLDTIQAERIIAERMMGKIPCITPNVSAILKHHPDFLDIRRDDPERMEESCLRRLRLKPEYREWLKIGEGYAFFMTLSQYPFLGNVITEIHDARESVREEILGQETLLGNPLAYEQIYGSRHGTVFFDLCEMYSLYEKRLAEWLRSHAGHAFPHFRTRQWFLTHLSGSTVQAEENDIPQEAVAQINRLIHGVMNRYARVVRAYWQTMADYIRARTMRRNLGRMCGIITNLLNLLVALRETGVAMRDLKPENVFIIADLSASPLLLADPEAFSIGLIALETAAVFRPDEGGHIPQPMLAGTPSYATPSHLFPNTLLSEAYPDLPRVLHLQDWHAVNSMIFNVVTGRRLTQETGRLVPTIVKTIQAATLSHQPKAELFEKYSLIFWRKGMEEFHGKLAQYKPQLEKVTISPPDGVARMIHEELAHLTADLEERIRSMVGRQKLFKGSGPRSSLIAASAEAMSRSRRRWRSGELLPQLPPRIRQHITDFMGCLIHLKRIIEWSGRIDDRIQGEAPVLSCHEILTLMFNVVLFTMYRPEWGIPILMAEQTDPDPGAFDDAYVVYEGEIDVEKTITGSLTP